MRYVQFMVLATIIHDHVDGRTNWGDEAQPVELKLPWTARLPRAKNPQVADLTYGNRLEFVVEGGKLRLGLDVAPRSARVMEIRLPRSHKPEHGATYRVESTRGARSC